MSENGDGINNPAWTKNPSSHSATNVCQFFFIFILILFSRFQVESEAFVSSFKRWIDRCLFSTSDTNQLETSDLKQRKAGREEWVSISVNSLRFAR